MTKHDEVKAEFMAATRGSGNISLLFGPHARDDRQKILSLIGNKYVPLKNCGYNACRKALLEFFKISGGGCIAGDDRLLMEYMEKP